MSKATNSTAGFIYLLEGGGYHKIGRTRNLDTRTALLRIQVPFETELIHSIQTDNACSAERLLHQYFHASRVRGEWFRLCHADVVWFKQVIHINFDGSRCLFKAPTYDIDGATYELPRRSDQNVAGEYEAPSIKAQMSKSSID